MSTKTEKRLERIHKLLERLEKQSAKGTPIVVEGRNDIHALHRLGITGDIILAKTSGKSFLDVLSEIEKKINIKLSFCLTLTDRAKNGLVA